MAVPTDELENPLDPDDALRAFLTTLGLLGFLTDTWEPGDWQYDLSDTVTTWFTDQWNTRIVPKIRSQFLGSATGDDLTLSAWTNYNRPRGESTFAVGDAVIENRGIFVGTIAAGTLRVKAASGKTFTNTNSRFLALWTGVGPYPTATFQFQADEAGSASNTLTNALPGYPTPLVAAPAGLLYVQSNAALLGSDEETDAKLARRCQLAAPERALSPLELLEAIALDPIGAMMRAKRPIPSTWPATVNVTRVRVVEVGNALIAMYLASPSGAAAGDSSTADTDVFIANVAIQLLGRPVGATINVLPASEKAINYGVISLKVRREPNLTKEDSEAAAYVALGDFWKVLPVGGERLVPGGQGYALIDHVRAVAMTPAGSYEATFGGVSVDTTLGPSEVAVPTYTVVATLVTQGT